MSTKPRVRKISGASLNPQQEIVQLLKKQCPEVFTEGKIDPAKLKATLGEAVAADGERYGLSWAGKSDCFRHIQEPTTATLVPDHKASLDFEGTKNIFIEGDNLQALKVLQKSYYGKVKMIYIDPPYNTGSDSFIYPDRFQESKEEYMERIGQKEEGHLTRDGMWQKNSKDNGHYHSNWLSMMYSRLFLARNLLRQDGVIFVSIDDYEAFNLRAILNEIFGEENFIAQLVWEKGRKNDAKLFSVGHEYMIVYAKSASALREQNTIWREDKPGAKEIWEEYISLLAKHGENTDKIEHDLKNWFNQLSKTHPSKRLARYKNVDDHGPWRDDDISWPGGGGPRYDVIHPVTKKPCKVPERGWVYSSPEKMQKMIEIGIVVFREDHTQPPQRKSHLKPIEYGFEVDFSNETEDLEDENNSDDEGLATQVMSSCIYKQSQVAVKYLRKLMGAKVFENPKDHEILTRIIRYCTLSDDIVLDFFAGSGTTAHAVMALNAEDGGNRQCISIQLGEPCDDESEAKKAGFNTIADIARERIRRAGKKIKEDTGAKIDYGFKAFKLDESNFKIWRSDVNNAEGLAKQMEMFIDNVKNDSTQENILYELMLKTGLDLNTPIEKVATKAGTYFKLSGGKLVLCIEQGMTEELADKVLAEKPEKFICLDKAFGGNDQLKTNVLLQMEQAGVDFLVI